MTNGAALVMSHYFTPVYLRTESLALSSCGFFEMWGLSSHNFLIKVFDLQVYAVRSDFDAMLSGGLVRLEKYHQQHKLTTSKVP